LLPKTPKPRWDENSQIRLFRGMSQRTWRGILPSTLRTHSVLLYHPFPSIPFVLFPFPFPFPSLSRESLGLVLSSFAPGLAALLEVLPLSDGPSRGSSEDSDPLSDKVGGPELVDDLVIVGVPGLVEGAQ